MTGKMTLQTSAVHASNRMQSAGVVNSIEPSSAFRYLDEGPQPYPRYFNTPNQQIVIDQICRLENADKGLVFSSGMAAITTTLLGLLNPGDHIVLQEALYGGTHSFVLKEFAKHGIEYTLAPCNAKALIGAIQENTRVVYAESPANPLMKVIDLRRLADGIRSHPIVSVVDNTFASPVNQNPIELGMDVCIHSGTKYLSGHSDLSFGAVVGNDDSIAKIYEKAILLGGNLNPLSLYLIERSIKTLFVRVRQQNDNALRIAQALERHKLITSVNYPGLASHPDHDIAKTQMKGFGGMMSFELADCVKPKSFFQALNLISPAMSLGGVESTITIPAFTSHKPIPKEAREQAGISDQLVRFSVGIESSDDLLADLLQALDKVSGDNDTASCQTNRAEHA